MTLLRAYRIALGLTLEDMAELLESNICSISIMEREYNTDYHSWVQKLYEKERDFLNAVYDVLQDADKEEFEAIAAAFMKYDERRTEFKDYAKNHMRLRR